jgi:hypothetical protein
VGSSGLEELKPQTVFMAPAGLASAPQAGVYYDRDLRLRQTPAGFVAYDAFAYKATGLSSSDVAPHSGAWTSPSGDYAASTSEDGALSMFGMSDPGAALATTEPGVCPVVMAWAPRANGIERLLCGGGLADAPDGTGLRVFDFDVTRQVFDPDAGRAVPLNGALSPSPLTNTRRFFTASADWLVAGDPERGVAVLSVPSGAVEVSRPLTSIKLVAPAELRFAPDERSLVYYDQGGLVWQPVPYGAVHSLLSRDGTGAVMKPPQLATCEEAVWASPDNWCGAPSSLGHFLISEDSRSILFEANAALWVTDLGISQERLPRRVASLPAACGSRCAGGSYAFAP